MIDKLEKSKTNGEEQVTLKNDKDNLPEILESGETNLDKITEELDPRIEASQARVLTYADKILESAHNSVGLSTEKAELVYKSGGFAEKINNIKERIAILTHNTKEKINLAQLKFQGIKNPEHVLSVIHYLEKVAVETESHIVEIDIDKDIEIKKKIEEFEKLGYSVENHKAYHDDKKINIWATKEIPYSFGVKKSQHLSRDIDEMLESPNDLTRMFEALRDNGYELNITKGYTFNNDSELKELFKDSNTLPFLEKLKTFGGSNITRDFFKSYGSISKISKLVKSDAAKHFLNPEAEKGIENISIMLGKPINFEDIESWANLSQDNTILEILSLLKQENKDKNMEDYIYKLNTIKNAGIGNEVITLLKDGFTEQSLGKLSGYGEENQNNAINNVRVANETFKKNPQLCQLIHGSSKVLKIEDPLSQDNIGKFQHLIEKVPSSGPAFENLASIDLPIDNYISHHFIRDIENATKYEKIFEVVADPNFKKFADICKNAGYNFTMNDFFNDNPNSNQLIDNYQNDAFRSAIATESGMELAKQLGVFEVPVDKWNGSALGYLSKIPNSISVLKKLEENYNYKYDPNNDYNNYQLTNLVNILNEPELCNKLFDTQIINVMKKVENEFSIKIPFNYEIQEIIKMIEEPSFQMDINDPETIIFLKKGLKDSSQRDISTNIRKMVVLARCDSTLRPIIEKMIQEFNYNPNYIYNSDYEYDEKSGEVIKKHELALKDSEEIQRLRDNPKIFEVQQHLEKIGINKNPLNNIKTLEMISENNLIFLFEKFIDSPKLQEFMWNNLDTAIEMSKLSTENISIYLEIFQKIDDSPSQEIQRLKDSLLGQLLKSEHPIEDYQKIESIFIKNNIPNVGKVYGVFETLHNPQNLEQKINQKTSPVLQQASTRNRYYTIYQDMLKIHIESGNRSMKEYAEILKGGGKLIERYENNGLESLNPREQEQLRYFIGKLETLQAKSALDTADDAFKIADISDLPDRIKHVREGLKVSENQTVLERISDMYLRPAGLKSLDELLDKMKKAKTSANERSNQMINEARSKSSTGEVMLEIKAGDFLKGVDARHISNILQNSSVAKEFLGASSDSDSTPLDTDISLVKPEDAEGGFTNSINSSIARDYGEILFALKDRGQYQHTTTGETAHAEIDKMELFQTGVLGERHYGIRTGFPTTEIDFMIARESLISQSGELEKLYFEIAQNGYYLPVTDISGKVIFTPEMYAEYHKSFAGLEKFDASELEYHPTTNSEYSYGRVSEIAAGIEEDSKRVDQVTQNIRSEIEQTLGVLGVKLRPEYDTSILGAELLDTGSTGRHTNTPGDFDFDFSLKLDAKDFPRATEFAQAIKEKMIFKEDISHQESGGYYQLRVKGVTSIGGKQLEKPLDIDIGFASKSDLSVYGSHDAIRDKLNYIKNHNGQEAYEQTIANVILTKKTLKEGHAYKKQEDGGFGGIGVENWILTNGGNMEEAFKGFKDLAYENGQRLPYERFKEKYKILDPGTNIKFHNHDNFINILKPIGYEAMLNTIENYLNQGKS